MNVIRIDRSNKFDLCYYRQVNWLRQKSRVALKWEVNTFGGNIYFAGDDAILIRLMTFIVLFII